MRSPRKPDKAPAESTIATSVRPHPPAERPAFYSIADTARILGMSEATLYRAIADGQFPAVRIRGRVIIPAKAIDAITDSALDAAGVADGYDVTGGAR
jgi:excisionase family DNA binding protein